MTHVRMTHVRALIAFLVVAGCATLGDETAFPGPLQTTGVGPFRLFTGDETNLPSRPVGAVIVGDFATTGGMRTEAALWVAAAPVLDPVPERDPDVPEDEIDWAQFGARSILRAATRPEDFGFLTSEVVLEATEAWEEDAVFDPWAFPLPDGRVRLYYAAAGGIGIAEGPASGPFVKVAGPILTDARSPTVIQVGDGSFWMFFERGDGIARATSADGLDFVVADEAIDVGLADAELAETRFAHPGAVFAVSPTGREMVRVYFEAHREDGTQVLALAASLDGVAYDRLQNPVLGVPEGDDDYRAPAPYLREDSVTLLYATAPKTIRGDHDAIARAIIGSVAPAFTQLVEPPPEEE